MDYHQNNQEKLPIAPREWPYVFRYTLVVITLIGLYWIFRIDFNFEYGSLLGMSHPMVRQSQKLQPISGVGGQETILLPSPDGTLPALSSDGWIESYLIDLDSTECVHAPIFTPDSRLYAIQTNGARYFDLRILLGDDPPEVRWNLYAQWLDSVSSLSPFSKREIVRGSLGYFSFLSDDIRNLPTRTEQDYIRPLWNGMKIGLWNESNQYAWLRFSKLPQFLSYGQPELPFSMKTLGLSKLKKQGTDFTWIWLCVFGISLIVILLYQGMNDFRSVFSYGFGMVASGIWTLVFWKWFLQPYDFLVILLIPAAFLFGWAVANLTKKLSMTENPDKSIRQFYRNNLNYFIILSLSCLVLSIVFDGVLSRLSLVLLGFLFGGSIAFVWTLAEWKIYSELKSEIVPSNQPTNHRKTILVFALISAFLLFVIILLQNKFTSSVTEMLTDETGYIQHQSPTIPYWIGPLDSYSVTEVIPMLQTKFPSLELYHPYNWQLKELSKEERKWFKPNRTQWTPLEVLRKKRQIKDSEIEERRTNLINSLKTIYSTIDQIVQSNPEDTLLTKFWVDFKQEKNIPSKLIQEIEKSNRNQFVKLYDLLFESNLSIKQTMITSRASFNAMQFIDWSKLFQLPSGNSIAVCFLPSSTLVQDIQLSLPTGVNLSGPAMLVNTEKDSMFELYLGLLLLLILFITLLPNLMEGKLFSVGFIFFILVICKLVGVSFDLCVFVGLLTLIYLFLIPKIQSLLIPAILFILIYFINRYFSISPLSMNFLMISSLTWIGVVFLYLLEQRFFTKHRFSK